jgi:hypothetical protein
MRTWGDGSAGAQVISQSGTLSDANLQHTDLTVNQNVTLSVASGTVIRCTGTFTNRGTIIVSPGDFGAAASLGSMTVAGQGVAHRAASNGASGNGSEFRLGGWGGVGLSENESRNRLHAGPSGGGGGGVFPLGSQADGGKGGGTLTILSNGAILNASTGIIRADGGSTDPSGCGGGAGGIILLASGSSVTNDGAISACGGHGGPADTTGAWTVAGGGGGSGGIVHFLSPTIVPGNVNVAGGTGGPGDSVPAVAVRSGGGAGGACGGNGGIGGSVGLGGSTPLEGHAGGVGRMLQSQLDPACLF